jgi:hypothetical protein
MRLVDKVERAAARMERKFYCRAIRKWPAMAEWTAAAKAEPTELEELDMEL